MPLGADEYDLALRALLWQAEQARSDVKRLFEFVMREEHKGRTVTCAPHQRVLFDFVQAHPMCVVRMPVGTSKTFSMATLALYLLGNDVSSRGALISSTQGQAMKPLGMVRDLIETSHPLRMVFPKLRRSPRKTDSWTITEITVDRPAGIRDPSIVAVGIDGAIAGARLSWAVVDDILDRENTSTPAGLQKVHEWFDSTVLSRLDPDGGRVVVTNTPWARTDLTYRLEESGWPTLTMDVMGNITINNAPDFDTDDIVPSARPGDVYRLTEHAEPKNARGEVTDETTPLWPGRYTWSQIEEIRTKHLAHRFNQLYLCICRDDDTARCKQEWIDVCKEQGRGVTLTADYSGSNMTFTGVDLAVGKGAQYDATAFFTFEQLPDGKRKILDVEFGQYDGPTIVRKLIDKAQRYKSIVRVENNASQDFIRQFARAMNASIPIRAHATGRNKAHPEFGVEGMFVELQNAAWIIPCSQATGTAHPAVQQFVNECVYYQSADHTGDVLMAAWLAREQAREFGLSAGVPIHRAIGATAGLAAGLLTR